MTAETPPGTFASEATLRRDGGEQPTGRLRVLVADDHPLVRDGLLRALLADGRFEVVGQAADGRDAVALAEEFAPDLAVLDVRMPILDGVRALAEIVEHVPQTHVVLLSAFRDDAVIHGAMAAGAAGYLMKDIDRVAICDALARVAAGQTVLPTVDPEDEGARVPAPAELTSRERNVLVLIRDGWQDAMIAVLLDIEPWDVDRYVDGIIAKLGALDRAGAIQVAVVWGLLR